MKALSIKQPWAELILNGRKKIELRNWNTNFRGVFLIHTSKNQDKESMKKFGFKELPNGFIIGKSELVEVKKYLDEKELKKDKDKHLADSSWGKFGFVLESPKRIEPISAKGNLGFWEFNKRWVSNQIKLADSKKEITKIYNYIKSLDLKYPDYKKWVEKCRKELESRYKKAFYSEEKSKIIGVIIFQPHKEKKGVLEIKTFWVSPENREKGVGSSLYILVEKFAKKNRFKKIQINTHDAKLIDFLSKRDFKTIKKEALYLPSQIETILQKKLYKNE